jgi:agmatine deiminase
MLSATACNKGQERKPENYSGGGSISCVFPGEFEKQQAIWMMWPSEVYNLNNRPVNPVMVSIIKALTPYIQVNIMSVSDEEVIQIKGLLKKGGCSSNNVHYYIINHQSIWARDVGPIFVKDSHNRLSIVDFGFNNYSRYGNEDYIKQEGQVDKRIAEALGLPVINTKLISEGGAIESNGQGTLMTTESVALKRNPELTKQQIEDEYKRVLGVRKIIWLKKGLAEDDEITSGHINEIARFADANTILLAQIMPEDRYANSVSQNSYLRLEENYKILENSSDQDGKPFRIIRIPMPPTLYQEANDTGKIPVRSYLNYAVTNGAVLMQTYWKPGQSSTLKTTEDQVKVILQNVFPQRDIIGIDAENVNLWGGGIHCITQHMPAS